MNLLRTERGARALSVAGIVSVIGLFVFATEPGIHKAPLFETAAWGILVLLAFAGWGGALDTLLFRDRRADFGLRAIWGASAMCFVGGVLAAASLYARLAGLLLVDVGLIAFCALLYRERIARAGTAVFAWRVGRRNGLLTTLMVVLLVATSVHYLGGIADANTNPYDDDTAYLPMVRKLIDTGTLIEPFSFSASARSVVRPSSRRSSSRTRAIASRTRSTAACASCSSSRSSSAIALAAGGCRSRSPRSCSGSS